MLLAGLAEIFLSHITEKIQKKRGWETIPIFEMQNLPHYLFISVSELSQPKNLNARKNIFYKKEPYSNV